MLPQVFFFFFSSALEPFQAFCKDYSRPPIHGARDESCGVFPLPYSLPPSSQYGWSSWCPANPSFLLAKVVREEVRPTVMSEKYQEARARVQKVCCHNKARDTRFLWESVIQTGALSGAQSPRATGYL